MTNPLLPVVNWKSIGPDPNNTPGYKDTDEYGNEWFMSANMERIILKTRDGRHFEAWTKQECWDQYLAAGFEINVQTLLVDALYFACSQAEVQGLTARADQFRSVYELARDGKIKVDG